MVSIGKFEAVIRDYESAAKEFEEMGAELISAAKQCEAMAADVHNVIRDTAEAYRQEGKKIFNRIEECALFTEDVRKTCEDVRRRMIESNGGDQLPLTSEPSGPTQDYLDS